MTVSLSTAAATATTRLTALSAHLALARTPTLRRTNTTMADHPRPPPFTESQAGHVPNQGPPKIHLSTAGTPNGYKVSVTLEELRDAYPEEARGALSYDVSAIEIWGNAQKHPDFLKVNPNGRIPAIVDDNIPGGHAVFESGSIQLWLVENYDKDNLLWFADPLLRSTAMSWLIFIQSGVAPMQGQANHFLRYAPVKVPYGIKRYIEETRRLYSVLEDGLAAGAGKWLVGDQYSIVDINAFSWVRSAVWAGVDVTQFPRVAEWEKRIAGRDAVKRGLLVPTAPRPADTDYAPVFKEVAEWIDKADKEIAEAKAKKQ